MANLSVLEAKERKAEYNYAEADREYHRAVIMRQDALEHLKHWQRKIAKERKINVSEAENETDQI